MKKGDGHITDFLCFFDIGYYLICAEKINCIIRKFIVRFIVYCSCVVEKGKSNILTTDGSDFTGTFCGIMDTEESNFRVTGFPVSDSIGNTGDSLVKNMVVCLFHDIESGGNKCITDFHRGSESGIRRNVCVIGYKDAFFIDCGEVCGRDIIPDVFIQVIIIPYGLCGICRFIDSLMNQIIADGDKMNGIIFQFLQLSFLLLFYLFPEFGLLGGGPLMIVMECDE